MSEKQEEWRRKRRKEVRKSKMARRLRLFQARFPDLDIEPLDPVGLLPSRLKDELQREAGAG